MADLPQVVASPSMADQAYTTIREAIVNGSLERGSKVTERGLASSLNISPTPVREALRRLEQDRLVVREGQREVRIARYDDEERVNITMIEDTLRALAARLAAESATGAQVAEMRIALEEAERIAASWSQLTEQDALDIRAALRRFHDAVDRASGSPTLVHLLEMVRAFGADEQEQIVLAEAAVDPVPVRQRFDQHRGIFEAIERRDAGEAERLMREHSRGSNQARLSAPRARVS